MEIRKWRNRWKVDTQLPVPGVVSKILDKDGNKACWGVNVCVDGPDTIFGITCHAHECNYILLKLAFLVLYDRHIKSRVYWKPACHSSPHEINSTRDGSLPSPFSVCPSLSLLLVFSRFVDHHKPLQRRAGVNISLDLQSLSSSLVLQTHHALPLLATTACCSGSDLEEACLSTGQHEGMLTNRILYTYGCHFVTKELWDRDTVLIQTELEHWKFVSWLVRQVNILYSLQCNTHWPPSWLALMTTPLTSPVKDIQATLKNVFSAQIWP